MVRPIAVATVVSGTLDIVFAMILTVFFGREIGSMLRVVEYFCDRCAQKLPLRALRAAGFPQIVTGNYPVGKPEPFSLALIAVPVFF